MADLDRIKEENIAAKLRREEFTAPFKEKSYVILTRKRRLDEAEMSEGELEPKPGKPTKKRPPPRKSLILHLKVSFNTKSNNLAPPINSSSCTQTQNHFEMSILQ